ncbi:bifunctional precorrin-2 dehydrogenase/sirohydrochlorin ferrochelatase [Paenibacillus sp. JSM ZJ436]
MVRYVPVMLNCEGKSCVIAGGGAVAERKASSLLQAGASVHIISPDVTPRLAAMADEGSVRWSERAYQPGDLEGAFLVYAATEHEEVNHLIAEEARSLGTLVNIAHHGEAGDFISPAVLRRGRLTLAVTTAGAGPLASVQLCRHLESELGSSFDLYLEFLYELRQGIKKQVKTPSERHRLMRAIHEQDLWLDIERGDFIPWTPAQIQDWITDNQEAE